MTEMKWETEVATVITYKDLTDPGQLILLDIYAVLEIKLAKCFLNINLLHVEFLCVSNI